MAQLSETLVSIPVGDVFLEGTLHVPTDATGLVMFAHGSGSSRRSPRNNYVANVLRDRHLGTLLFDLLTEAEDQSPETRFDISLLANRLVAATEWLRERDETTDLRTGYFGASTGAAAALRAADRLDGTIGAIVSRGGRVDLAAQVLPAIQAPCLFVVGGADTPVLRLNREAYAQLVCEKALHVVEGAGHLFEGEGQLEEVARVAAEWFGDHLS